MKMKKFINSPETITDEELVGLVLSLTDDFFAAHFSLHCRILCPSSGNH